MAQRTDTLFREEPLDFWGHRISEYWQQRCHRGYNHPDCTPRQWL